MKLGGFFRSLWPGILGLGSLLKNMLALNDGTKTTEIKRPETNETNETTKPSEIELLPINAAT